MTTANSRPIPADTRHCLSGKHQCRHILVPTSNRPDRCTYFRGAIIDRDDRQRPERIIECLTLWPNDP